MAKYVGGLEWIVQGNPGSSTSSKLGNNFTALLDLSFLVSVFELACCSINYFKLTVVDRLHAITTECVPVQKSSVRRGGSGSPVSPELTEIKPPLQLLTVALTRRP